MFEQELKVGDDRYVKDLRKQAEELDLLMERMEDQIKTLTKAYREELAQIEVGPGSVDANVSLSVGWSPRFCSRLCTDIRGPQSLKTLLALFTPLLSLSLMVALVLLAESL